MVRIHLSSEQQLAILCSRTFLGKRAYGFQAGALSEFGRGLDALSERELAKLAVIARWPGRWRSPERAAALEVAVDSLIRRSRAINR